MLNQLLGSRSAVTASAVLLLAAVGCGGGGGGSKKSSASVAPSTSNVTPTNSSSLGAFVHVPPMTEARVHHTATLLANGQVLLVGGQNGATTVSATTEIFDPATGATTKGPNLGTARMHHAAILLPTQKVLVVGGQSDTQGLKSLATTEIYDPIKGTWAAGPALTEARSCPAVAMYVDANITKVLIAGGAAFKAGVATSLKSADIYNADANTLAASTAAMAEDRYAANAVTQSNGQILIQGGYSQLGAATGPKVAQSEVYDIKNALFVAVATLAPRAESALVMVGTDSYAIGGTDGTASLASVEKFNGATWSQGTALSNARRGHTASVANGDVLIAGGLNGTTAYADCELISSAQVSGTMPALGVARAYHTATAIAGGQVVVAGGADGQGNILTSIEVYAPTGTTVAGSTPTNTGTTTPGSTGVLPPPTPVSTVNIASLSPTSGAVGTAVTITGTGFDATPAKNIVKFNGVLATVTAVNLANPAAQTITTTVPANATTGAVSVEVASVVSPQNPIFTVQGPAVTPPRILFVLPSSSKIFLPVSITGQDFGPKPVCTFNGVPTINVINLSTKSLPFIGSVSELVVLTPPGATTGPLIVSNQGVQSNPFFFTVN